MGRSDILLIRHISSYKLRHGSKPSKELVDSCCVSSVISKKQPLPLLLDQSCSVLQVTFPEWLALLVLVSSIYEPGQANESNNPNF